MPPATLPSPSVSLLLGMLLKPPVRSNNPGLRVALREGSLGSFRIGWENREPIVPDIGLHPSSTSSDSGDFKHAQKKPLTLQRKIILVAAECDSNTLAGGRSRREERLNRGTSAGISSSCKQPDFFLFPLHGQLPRRHWTSISRITGCHLGQLPFD